MLYRPTSSKGMMGAICSKQMQGQIGSHWTAFHLKSILKNILHLRVPSITGHFPALPMTSLRTGFTKPFTSLLRSHRNNEVCPHRLGIPSSHCSRARCGILCAVHAPGSLGALIDPIALISLWARLPSGSTSLSYFTLIFSRIIFQILLCEGSPHSLSWKLQNCCTPWLLYFVPVWQSYHSTVTWEACAAMLPPQHDRPKCCYTFWHLAEPIIHLSWQPLSKNCSAGRLAKCFQSH